MIIQAQDLTKKFGDKVAVDSVSFDVEKAEVFGFLGPNGAGKTTTIKMLTTLLPPTSGRVSILGHDLKTEGRKIRDKIGVVQQQDSFDQGLNVETSLDIYGLIWNVPKPERKKKIDELVERFGMSEFRKKATIDLSAGQRRRLQVAREFMHDMDLLFLDEPTVGLDPSARRGLLDYIRGKVRDGLTIFFTTHILEEAEYLCDEIAIINRGRIIAVDTPDELKNKFGREKTIKIRLGGTHDISSMLEGLASYDISHDEGTVITIHSADSERALARILQVLSSNNIGVEDLSVVPTSLEEIFLKVVKDSNSNGENHGASNNQAGK